jgi:hypothetical protein
MRRVGVGLSLAVLVILALPAGAPTASIATPTLQIPLPNAGDISVAEAVFKLKGAKVTKALRPKLTVVNAKQLGKDVVVVAAVRQEAKNKNRFDVTAVVIRRGVRTTSAVRVGLPGNRVEVYFGEQGGLTSAFIAQNVVQGNYLPKLPFDCGFGTSSFLAGKRTGLPPARDTIADVCGFWFDQVWEPQSFASGFGANWCAVPVDPPAAGAATYTFHFNCNFPTRAAALEDPLKAATILNVIPDSGACFSANVYTYVCPQEQGTSGTLKATFAAPLPAGFEFGFGTSTDGQKINEFFPARVIDDPSAAAIITELAKKYDNNIDRAFGDAATFILTGNNAEACKVLRGLLDRYSQHITSLKGEDQGLAAIRALKALDCNTR